VQEITMRADDYPNDYENYLFVVVKELREQFANREHALGRVTSDQDKAFVDGFRMAQASVLSLMIQQAEVFGIDKASIGLAGFDPEQDLA